MVVAEAVMNLACVGARPVALVNCLNFGNPEHPEVMWELSEAIDGMAEACRAFDLPVVGGNVSLYNETRGADIAPTPIVGVLGVIDRLEVVPPGVGWSEGHTVWLVGPAAGGLGGSAWAGLHGASGGELPALDLLEHARVSAAVRELAARSVVSAAHDVATGGLAVTLAEMAIAGRSGLVSAAVVDHRQLFSESPSRVVVTAAPEAAEEVAAVLERHAVGALELGVAGGARLQIGDLIDRDLDELGAAWRDVLPAALGHGTVSG